MARRRCSREKAPASAGESLADRKKRARKIITALKKLYPEADTALEHTSALELLVATILSAQSTDETVNKVTPVLLVRYPTVEKLAAAAPGDVEKIIHRTGFFRQKTKSIIGACRTIVEQFGGEVPQTIEELTQLPGVARQRRSRHLVRPQRGRGGGYARRAACSSARADLVRQERKGRGQDRAGPDAGVAAEGMDVRGPRVDLARPAGVLSPQAHVCSLHAQQALPRRVHVRVRRRE